MMFAGPFSLCLQRLRSTVAGYECDFALDKPAMNSRRRLLSHPQPEIDILPHPSGAVVRDSK
jgi:hypothetical protein